MAATLTSIEPATGATLWTGEAGDVEAEVAAARAAWAGWAARPFAFRVETLRRFANVVRGKIEPFADLIARETGKPLWEARTEVEAVVNKVDISVAGLCRPHRRRSGSKARSAPASPSATSRTACSACSAPTISRRTCPTATSSRLCSPAMRSSSSRARRRRRSASISSRSITRPASPRASIRCVQGGPETGKALAAHAGLDGLLFTGSARAGLALHRQFAETPHKILALEMGGNNPLVVWNARDVHAAAAIAVQSAYMSAGQRCTAARRLIVEDGKHEELVETIVQAGRPADRRSSPRQPGAVHGPGDRQPGRRPAPGRLPRPDRQGRPRHPPARPQGRRPALPDPRSDRRHRGRSAGPTRNCSARSCRSIRVPDFDAAIAEANATRYGLAASLVGGSPELYDRFWANVRAGVVNWNKPTNGAPSTAPFGGIGLSGNHRPSAYYAADYCAYPVTSSEAESAARDDRRRPRRSLSRRSAENLEG